MFSPLGEEQLTTIVDIQIAAIQKRLADRRIQLDVQSEAKKWLVTNGFDPIYGARPLRRLVQTSIGDQLAKMILSGAVKDGDKVTVAIQDGNLQLSAHELSSI